MSLAASVVVAPSADSAPARPRRRSLASFGLQAAVFEGLALMVAAASFRVPYCADDVSVLAEVGRFRLGTTGLLQYLTLVHNEHSLPLLRLAIWASTRLAGLDPTPFRILIFGVHGITAWVCGDIAARLSGSRRASWIAGGIYAAAGGIATSMLWNTTIGVFAFGACGLALATRALLLVEPRVGRAVGWLILGASALNGVAVAAPALAALLWLGPPQRRGRRAAALVASGVVLALLARWNYSRFTTASPLVLGLPGFGRGLVLIGLVPARLAWGFLPFPLPSVEVCLPLGIAGWVLLALSLNRLPPRPRLALAWMWSAPLGLALLVGMARSSNSSLVLLQTDRYFALFVLPFAIHLALLADRALGDLRTAATRTAAAATTVLALFGAHAQFERGVMWSLAAASSLEWQRLDGLAQRVSEAVNASDSALGVPPGDIELGPLGWTSIGAILVATHPQLLDQLTRGRPPGSVSATAWNAALDRWGDELPARRSPICVRGGRFTDSTPLNGLDFLAAPYSRSVVSGFGEREAPGYRWMTGDGRLVLPAWQGPLLVRASTPATSLRRSRTGFSGIKVRAVVDGRDIGSFLVESDVPATFRLNRSPADAGRSMTLELVADQTWRPSELEPQSLDPRIMSIALFSVAPESAEGAPVGCSGGDALAAGED